MTDSDTPVLAGSLCPNCEPSLAALTIYQRMAYRHARTCPSYDAFRDEEFGPGIALAVVVLGFAFVLLPVLVMICG